nr:hypothetical protein [uncultured Rhodoferax sp.]
MKTTLKAACADTLLLQPACHPAKGMDRALHQTGEQMEGAAKK